MKKLIKKIFDKLFGDKIVIKDVKDSKITINIR
jgi:hypothetical protein